MFAGFTSTKQHNERKHHEPTTSGLNAPTGIATANAGFALAQTGKPSALKQEARSNYRSPGEMLAPDAAAGPLLVCRGMRHISSSMVHFLDSLHSRFVLIPGP